MSEGARFEVSMVFRVPGRGSVVSGNILEGTIRKGMLLTLPSGASRAIQSVEFVDKTDGAEVGLMIGNLSAEEEATWNALSPGTALEVHESVASP